MRVGRSPNSPSKASPANGFDSLTWALIRSPLGASSGDRVAVGDGEFYGHDTAYRVDLPWGRVLVRAMAAPRIHPGDPVGVAYAGPRADSFPADGPAVTELIERPAAVPA
jgi:hypothetical protein